MENILKEIITNSPIAGIETPPLGAGGLWTLACSTILIPENGGACVLINGEQIAIFNFTRRGEWYATQNLCPHKQQMVLSRGMIGSSGDEPKVACPFHKKTFSLQTGNCLSSDDYKIKTYPVKIEDGMVFVDLSM